MKKFITGFLCAVLSSQAVGQNLDTDNLVDLLGESYSIREGAFFDFNTSCDRVDDDTFFCSGNSFLGPTVTYFADIKVTRRNIIQIRHYGSSANSECNYIGRLNRVSQSATGTYICNHLPGRFRFEMDY